MKTTLTTIAIFLAVTGAAQAACNVTVTMPVSLTNPLTEADCASAATVASQGTAITGLQTDVGALQTTSIDHEGRIVTLETNDTAQDATLTGHTSAITALQSENAAQQASIDDHETRIDAGEAKNTEQDGRLDDHDAVDADHETRITANTTKNVEQDTRLDGHDTAIGSLETDNVNQWTAINAHSALLSEHSATLANHGKRLDKHEKGLAIAMSMPDAWLSDKERFAIAGNIGGFGDEIALGIAAIGRIDGTWSLNAKAGTDSEAKEFGWSVGARAGF